MREYAIWPPERLSGGHISLVWYLNNALLDCCDSKNDFSPKYTDNLSKLLSQQYTFNLWISLDVVKKKQETDANAVMLLLKLDDINIEKVEMTYTKLGWQYNHTEISVQSQNYIL